MLFPQGVVLEERPCPLGCPPGDEPVVHQGHDRLHGLPGEFQVVKCQSCGLMRTDPRPVPPSMAFFYPESYRPYLSTRDFREPVRHSRGWLRQIYNGIFSTDPKPLPQLPPGKLLEIGSASGAFLHLMSRRGWQVEGLEFSESAAKYAQSRGYQVHVGALESLSGLPHDYDLIVGWHVLEHLHDPVSSYQMSQHREVPEVSQHRGVRQTENCSGPAEGARRATGVGPEQREA
ncbi:MAG: class I SAM-dependent methyltransferase, partial [Acidimicrobiia bacterium]|nr:class I SAM-dependent methyltransferase [Acidimicrobiia bacterium]